MTIFTNALKTAVLLGLMMGLCLAIGSYWGREGMILGLVLGGFGAFISYFFSDSLALMSVGAQPLPETEHPQLHRMVERLSQRAGIPKPRLYWSPEQAPNAFATGRNPKHGVVCVTDGLLQMMNEKEIEGVVAHELAHIKHRDILISTIAAVLAGAISHLAWMMMWGGLGHRRSDDEEGGGGNPIFAILLMLLAPIAAGLIQLAVSRSREYAADAGAANYAGGPEGLISALRKLAVANKQIPMNVNPAESHMFIVAPLTAGESMASLFMTHPPVEKRIAKLIEQMQAGTNPYAVA